MDTSVTKYQGTTVRLGGDDFVVPALSLRQVQVLQSKLQSYTGGVDDQSTNVVIDVVHAALSRNYPELTRDDVSDRIDLGNMQAVMNAVMGISGLVKKDPASGEAVAASIGTS